VVLKQQLIDSSSILETFYIDFRINVNKDDRLSKSDQ